MKNILLSILFILACIRISHAQDFVREYDRVTGKPILRGKISFNNIMKESTCSWFEEGVQNYAPNRDAINELSQVSKDYRYVLFVGTWCEDTRNLLPKFYKTMLEANISQYSVEMYGVNRAKQSLKEEHKVYKIERVPTIIVLHQNREVGRIVESVNSTIEEELAVMMAKDMKELEVKKAEYQLKWEQARQAELKRMSPRDRKRYYYKDYYFPNSSE